jgi:ribose-phosphate pyrophosphokinase
MTSPNDAIAQQELLADAAKTSSASRITAVAPFMGYLRQDRKAKGREGVGARRLIRNLVNNGFDSFVTVDMHSASVQVAFDGPFDNLIAQMLLREAMIEEIAGYNRADCLVVAPDAGATKMADRHRKELGTKLLYLAKSRDAGDSLKISREERVEEADGRVCVVFDDMIDTAGTLVSAANALKNSGAIAVYVAATHGLFSEPAIENLQGAPIDRILVTDTVPVDDVSEALGEKLRVVSVGPMIANALKQIITNGSVSELFNDQNHL